jgi:hypothetical protein
LSVDRPVRFDEPVGVSFAGKSGVSISAHRFSASVSVIHSF